MKIRTIITHDAEVDDQNSLRHFMFYANDVDLQGIVQTSSKFHWEGRTGAVKPEANPGDFPFGDRRGPFDQPYRWTGTDWMYKVAYDYELDYPNLCKHADGYPDPAYIRSIIKIGNIGYEGEMDGSTPGSELIKKHILDDDERTLYIQVWGGTNTIAQALKDIQTEYEGSDGWADLHAKITRKVVLTACGEQDGTYRSYIAEEWPDMQFVKTLQMRSYAYPWYTMPESDSKDTLKADYMKREIINGKSALCEGYSTWMDGHVYMGEAPADQFGSNPDIATQWFGSRMGLTNMEKYDFLSEGDSPTYFTLFGWGLRALENFGYGGIAGRYIKKDETNSKGQPLNIWDVAMDKFTGRDGVEVEIESMWPYVVDIQNDFAARNAWASAESYAEGEHAPVITIAEGNDICAAAGESVSLTAQVCNPDGDSTAVTFRIYAEASAASASEAVLKADGNSAAVTIPANAAAGDQIHIIAQARSNGHFKLTRYQQVIITVK